MEWNFKPGKVTYETGMKGDLLPHLEIGVWAGKRKIGYIEVHLHSHRGRDKKTDISFGFTGVVERMPDSS